MNANPHSSTNYFSLSVTGTLLLKKDEYLSVSVFSAGDSNYKIHTRSGFSCHQLTELHGFHAVKNGQQDVGSRWSRITRWRTDGRAGLYSTGGGFDADTGIFTASKNGAYYCTARMRFDMGHGENGRNAIPYAYLQLRLDEDGVDENMLFSVESHGMSNNHLNLDLVGTVALTVGQRVSVWVFSNTTMQINFRSGFGCHLLTTHTGFYANLGQDAQYSTGWSTLLDWRSWGTSERYKWNGSPSAGGVYTAPDAGYYVCVAQVKVRSCSSNEIVMCLLL